MTKNLHASFIIVNYNGQKFLKRLIDSLLSQDDSSFEIIIVDNDSKDTSVKYISKNFPSIKLIRSKNVGYGLACNLGAKNASGEFLIFLNPDTYVPKNFLSKYLKTYQQKSIQYKNPLGCLNCRVVDYASRTTRSKKCGRGVIDIFGTPKEINDSRGTDDSFFVFGTALFIKRKVFQKSLGFNPNIFLYGEEIDLCWRLKTQGYRHLVDNNNFFNHFNGGSFGDNQPKQNALMTYGCFIASITNYQLSSLFFVLILYPIYLLFLIFFLPLLKGFKLSYSQELILIFKNLFTDYKKIIDFRKKVQKLRRLSDFRLIKYYSIIPSVLSRFLTS